MRFAFPRIRDTLDVLVRIAAGKRRFDFLRGQERYKYEWGAVDEPIYRILVERAAVTSLAA